MKKILLPHTLIDDITVSSILNTIGKKLTLTFTVKGALENYIFPKEEPIKRKNELWKATCFELFLANANKDEYYELNLSPSLAWNFYCLEHYRAEVKEVVSLVEPTITVSRGQGRYEISFGLEGLDLKQFDSCNLTAILLTQEGERTFWSLEVMEDSPDFHNRAYFVKTKAL